MQYSSDPLTIREQSLTMRFLARYECRLAPDQTEDAEQVQTLYGRLEAIRENTLHEDELLYEYIKQRIKDGQDRSVIVDVIEEKTWMDEIAATEYYRWCDNRYNDELIYQFNKEVTEWCREHGTYEVEDFEGTGRTLIIENHSYIDEDTGLQVVEWESWFDDDHSITSVGKTPYEVYCD